MYIYLYVYIAHICICYIHMYVHIYIHSYILQIIVFFDRIHDSRMFYLITDIHFTVVTFKLFFNLQIEGSSFQHFHWQ